MLQVPVSMWLLWHVVGMELGLIPRLPHTTPPPWWLSLIAATWCVAGGVAPFAIWRRRAWGYFIELPVMAAWMLFAWALRYADEAHHPTDLRLPLQEYMAWFSAAASLYLLWLVFKTGLDLHRRTNQSRRSAPPGTDSGDKPPHTQTAG
jgi:hypothetical protein